MTRVTTEIRQTESLSDTEKQHLFEWGADIFGAANFNLRWRPKELHFMLDVDGVPVSHVGVVKHEVRVAGEPVNVGGVGGVVTLPAGQGHGYARELMQHTVRFFETWNVNAGLLFCLPRRIPFYESQGWSVIHHPVMVEQPSGEVISPLEVMVLPLRGYRWPDGAVQLDSFPW